MIQMNFLMYIQSIYADNSIIVSEINNTVNNVVLNSQDFDDLSFDKIRQQNDSLRTHSYRVSMIKSL